MNGKRGIKVQFIQRQVFHKRRRAKFSWPEDTKHRKLPSCGGRAAFHVHDLVDGLLRELAIHVPGDTPLGLP